MAPRLGVGVWSMQAVPQRPSHHLRLYADLLEDAQLAEALGLDSIWLSEHHFWFDGYCPAPLVAAGAVLGKTRRLKVGTAVMLLPMHSARKVAGDARVLSRLSEGRLELGVGLGYREIEFDAFGLRRRDRGSLMDRLLPELVRGCAEEGELAPPVYVGVASPVAARRAGRLGLPLLADSTLNVNELRACLGAYRDSAQQSGAMLPPSHAIQRDVWVTDDRERDWAVLYPELRYMRRQYGGWSQASEPGESTTAYLGRLEGDIEAKLRNLVIGDVPEVAGELRRFLALGFELIICRTQFGNLPREQLHQSMEGLAAVSKAILQ